MGQWKVYNAIRTMGDNVTARQIHEFLVGNDDSKDRSGSKCITTTLLYLKTLCSSGLVAKSPCPGTRCGRWTYCIVDSYPERNVVVVATTTATPATA